MHDDPSAGAVGFDDETGWFMVVVNNEEQYSIWPGARPLPPGWRDAGHQGSKKSCLAHIDQVWTDMRPLSLRRRMDGEPQ
jgi:MbtH protein